MAPRPTRPADALAWLVELARTLPGLLPGAVDAGTRQRVLVAVSDENRSRSWAYVHGAWRDFTGAGAAADTDVEERIIAFARASARARRPVDTTTLDVTLPSSTVKAVRATVAAGELAGLTTAVLDRLVDRLATRAASPSPVDGNDRSGDVAPTATSRTPVEAAAAAIVDAGLAAVTAPLTTVAVAAATGARLAHRLAPPAAVDAPAADEANLLTHVVARALQAWLANAGVRLVLLRLPVAVTVALRDGRSECTVRIGQGTASVRNGIDPDAVLLVEGELRPVLRAAAGNVLDQLGHVRLRRA